MDYNLALNTIMEIGHALLSCGAEIYRVEESIQRLCAAYELPEAQVFAISSCIFLSFQDKSGQNHSRIKRVWERTTDLDKLEKLNSLCREVCADPPAIEETAARLSRIEKGKIYGFWMQLAGYCVISGFFTLLFQGSWLDALAAVGIGALLKLLVQMLEGLDSNFFFLRLIASAMTGACAMGLAAAGMPIQADKVIIGVLMNLVPGVALTNFMRDLMAGDFISGMFKLTEALLIAVAIALGTGVAVWLMRLL